MPIVCEYAQPATYQRSIQRTLLGVFSLAACSFSDAALQTGICGSDVLEGVDRTLAILPSPAPLALVGGNK